MFVCLYVCVAVCLCVCMFVGLSDYTRMSQVQVCLSVFVTQVYL